MKSNQIFLNRCYRNKGAGLSIREPFMHVDGHIDGPVVRFRQWNLVGGKWVLRRWSDGQEVHYDLTVKAFARWAGEEVPRPE